MTESKADTASTQKADAKPAATKATAKPTATKSAAENENLPSASAPAVASEAQAKLSETTLTAGEVDKIENSKGGLGPFQDTARPVGAALDATTDPDSIDTNVDFESNEAFTVTEGDVLVAVREHNNRNIVEVVPVGWQGPGQVFAPYQAKLLHKALGKVIKKLK